MGDMADWQIEQMDIPDDYYEKQHLLQEARAAMADKKLYQGIFNYQRQVVEEFTRSDSVAGAYRNMTARLAVRFNTTGFTMRQYFDGKRRNYEIIEVKNSLIDKVDKTCYNGFERRNNGLKSDR